MRAENGSHEEQRLVALHATGMLDTPPEAVFDDLVRVAAAVVGTPISLVTFVDADRQWFKATHQLDLEETPRQISFCSHAIEQIGVFVVEDAATDARFRDNPLVTGAPGIRFYAGAPIVTPAGHALGTVCVIDTQPRELTPDQREALRALSRQAVREIELRRAIGDLAARVHGQRRTLSADGTADAPSRAQASDGVATVDDDGRLVRLNDAARTLIGDVEGSPAWQLFREADRFEVAWSRGELVDRRSEWTLLTGRPVEVTITDVPVGDADVRALLLRDLTERRRLEARLRHLAHHDPLTGLLNRARFDEELAARAAEVERYGGDASVLVLDLDDLKALNDEYGHQAGDRALVLLAGAVRSRLRESDIIARIGGDELAVLLPHTPLATASAVADEIAAAVRAITADGLPPLAASVGAAPLGADPGAALADADLAMYAAKRRGVGDA